MEDPVGFLHQLLFGLDTLALNKEPNLIVTQGKQGKKHQTCEGSRKTMQAHVIITHKSIESQQQDGKPKLVPKRPTCKNC